MLQTEKFTVQIREKMGKEENNCIVPKSNSK